MNSPSWNERVKRFPGAHFLQTEEWGKVKAAVGWKASYHSWARATDAWDAAAMVLERALPLGGFAKKIRILYVPKGPLLQDWRNAETRDLVFNDLEAIARSRNAIFIKIDPDIPLAYGMPNAEDETHDENGKDIVSHLTQRGWLPSQEQVQFRNTIILDLTADCETLLSRMKQKTRYNIRLSERKGVSVRHGNAQDLSLLYTLYAETSIRDGFVIRDPSYYFHAWRTFLEAGIMDILIAEVDQEPIAGLVLYHFGKTAWYLYGMSSSHHREKMATYLLQWKAILHAKSLGCTRYDLWGAPDTFSENDPMWGVFRFKQGFGGIITRTIGAWDFPVQPFWYKLYTHILPKLLELARRRGIAKTRRSIDSRFT